MKHKKQNVGNVPNLRFPGFEGEWEKKRLIDIAPLQRGFDLPVGQITSGQYPVVFSNGIAKHHNEFKVLGPGVVTGRSGTIGSVSFVESDFWPHNTTLWVTNFKGNNPKFIYHFYVQYDLSRFGTGSGVPTLNRNDIHSQEVYFPELPEQTEIASFLSVIDERIIYQSKLIQRLETLMLGLREELFTQKFRFKDEHGNDFPDWEPKVLGEIGNTYNGLTGKTKENFGCGKRYIQYKQIFDSSKIEIERCELVDVDKNEAQNRVRFGDVFFTISSETPDEIGMSSVLLNEVDDLYLNSFCFGYRPTSLTTLSPYYARFHFRSNLFRDSIKKLAQGSTRFNMSKTELLKTSILLPSIQEQSKIANCLTAISDKIETEKNLLAQYETQKKYLLQQLFV